MITPISVREPLDHIRDESWWRDRQRVTEPRYQHRPPASEPIQKILRSGADFAGLGDRCRSLHAACPSKAKLRCQPGVGDFQQSVQGHGGVEAQGLIDLSLGLAPQGYRFAQLVDALLSDQHDPDALVGGIDAVADETRGLQRLEAAVERRWIHALALGQRAQGKKLL